MAAAPPPSARMTFVLSAAGPRGAPAWNGMGKEGRKLGGGGRGGKGAEQGPRRAGAPGAASGSQAPSSRTGGGRRWAAPSGGRSGSAGRRPTMSSSIAGGGPDSARAVGLRPATLTRRGPLDRTARSARGAAWGREGGRPAGGGRLYGPAAQPLLGEAAPRPTRGAPLPPPGPAPRLVCRPARMTFVLSAAGPRVSQAPYIAIPRNNCRFTLAGTAR